MAYLLKIEQFERSYDIGVFKSEESIYKFIESIPFVKKEVFPDNYINYFMNFKDIPDYYEVNYNNYIYIISKFSFIPDEGEIYFNWREIHLWDEKESVKETFIEGETIVDAYSFSNNEVKSYIEKREELYKETKKYYESKGLKITRNALGSEDGEYVELLNGSILYLLDPRAVEIWEESKDIEEFMDKYKKYEY
ncbi:Uncharacterised protein [[Clostridium] sordellii]|uniref:Uncharacterized protein n=1 Tax=Paraclostridium sordellii TaxID=1505 RepID=A0A9P1KYG4_PARSO|nr:hypothetical protein [Paeniclostridium sordellii]MBS6022486.1 hypothetical protein [Paeniclostridium sordellii]MDU4412770.1 hypothetical protein [Paeniclostridium sordellii]CEN87627.1 Uncharacterised protein [[Clostridium] sordellii] [Paeniclostridium sordellii]CEO32677.1 Uncharacterised protein [[Clostridium] sordellii] [Paeniclostridium sordellii]CEO35517.1 Uncharacterised protein [[Clostridium] sordellii] [Paeniclostridium sordellii]